MPPKSSYEDLAGQCARLGLPEPVPEFRFHPVRRWRLDMAWPMWRIGAEIHGAVHTGGRHVRGTGFTKDREKMNMAQLLGWQIFEFTPGQIREGYAAQILRSSFQGGLV